jgi:hypothetical protein
MHERSKDYYFFSYCKINRSNFRPQNPGLDLSLDFIKLQSEPHFSHLYRRITRVVMQTVTSGTNSKTETISGATCIISTCLK